MGKLTEEQKLYGVIILLIAVTGFCFWNYSVKPSRIEIERLRGERSQKEQKFNEDAKTAARLPYVKAESVRLKKELAYVERALPKEKDIPFLLSVLTQVAEDNKISFDSFISGDVVDRGDYSMLPITLGGIKTTYHNLAVFLTAIGNLDRLISPVNIRLSGISARAEEEAAKEGKEETVAVDLELESYLYR